MRKKRVSFTKTEVETAFRTYYPNAVSIPLFDSDYDLPTDQGRELALKLYKGFQKWMKLMRLVSWMLNKMDCDKRAWLFRAYSIAVAAVSRIMINNFPHAMVTYDMNAVPGNGHAITALYIGMGVILEIDPAPLNEGGGIINLTLDEKGTANFFL